MDEIRCKKCGLWLERPDSICPRCIAIDGSEEEKRKFYENMDEHSIENAHISSIKKVAETLLRDGQHYTIDPREIINLINMLEYARATRIPPDSGAIRELGTRLVDLLDEDDWNNLEPFLLKAKGAQIELEKRLAEIEGQEKEVRGEPATVTEQDGCPIEKAVLRREWKKFNAYFQAEEKRHKEIDEHITALRTRLVQAEGKVEKVANEICGLLEYFDCIEEGDQTEEERNFVADLTRMQKILERK